MSKKDNPRQGNLERPETYVYPAADSGEPALEAGSGSLVPEDWSVEDRKALWERAGKRDNVQFAYTFHEILVRSAGKSGGFSEDVIEQAVARGPLVVDFSDLMTGLSY